MTTLDYLSDLRRRGVVVSLADGGDKLKVSAPRDALDEAGRTELAARKEEVLAFLREASAAQPRELPAIEPRAVADPPQLSAAQERVWKLYRLDPGGTGMSVAVPWRLRGPIDGDALALALADVAARHDTLRCRFADADHAGGGTGASTPVTLTDEPGIALERLAVGDRSHPSAGDGTDDDPLVAARRLADSVAARPFDLAEEVARAALIEIGPDDHVLVIVFHQIVFDWGAAAPLIDDLAASYEARRQDRAPALDRPAVGYLDYAAWQRTWLVGEGPEPHRRFWAEQLATPYRPLPLPSPPIAADPATRPDRQHEPLTFQLTPALTDRLKALSQSAGATLYMTLLGAWQALLAGYGRRDEAIVFSLLNLNRAELKPLIGLFANPLPVRVALDGDPTPVEVARRVSGAALGAYAHQDLPLEQVMDRFRLDQSGGAAGPFQALFIFQHEPTPSLRLGDAEGELLTVGDHAAAFDLRLFAEDTDDGVRGWLEHDTAVIPPEAARRMLDHYVVLLERLVDGPDRPISTLLPVTAEDRAAAERAPVAPDAEPVAPRTDRERELVEAWSRLFGREIGIDDDFFALGGHSLLAVQLFADIEAATGRTYPLATLFEAPTIRALATVVDQEDFTLGWTSLVPIKPTGSRTPIFCVAALGDEIIQFGELADLLSADQPFYGLQQGLDRADRIHTTIPAIARHYLAEVRAARPEGPYLIAGYCFGALVAYEMAQQLLGDGETVALVSIEGEAPGGMYPEPRTTGQRVSTVASVLRHYGPGDAVRYARKRLGKIWRWSLWTRLRHHLHRVFDRLGLDLPDSLRDILQINARAADDYAPVMQPYPGDICVLRAEVTTPGYVYEDRLGWGRFVEGDVRCHWIPGDHEGIWKTPNVQVFAKKLEQVVEEELSLLGPRRPGAQQR